MNSRTQRLIALWAFAECGLGGLIHALHLPISGLLVGSIAVAVITLLMQEHGRQWQPLAAALMTVLAVKAGLSPQSPPTAYLAVGFQAIAGFVIYRLWGIHRTSVLVFSILALAESALQRLLVLWLLFDRHWLAAIDEYLIWVLRQIGLSGSGVAWTAVIYIMAHVLAGAFIGWQIDRFLKKHLPGNTYQGYWTDADYFHWLCQLQRRAADEPTIRQRFRPLYWLLGAIGVYAAALAVPAMLAALLRTVSALMLWFGVLMPLGGRFVARLFHASEQPNTTVGTLPLLRVVTVYLWKKNSHFGIKKRLSGLLKGLFLWALRFEPEKMERRIYLLAGPVHTGKSTTILHWLDKQTIPISGMIAPEINGLKQAFFIKEKEYVAFEAPHDREGQPETVAVGRYVFLTSIFDRANDLFRKPHPRDTLVVVDEIGKLELRGEGLDEGIRALLSSHKGMLLFVVRDSLLEEVVRCYGLGAVGILHLGDFPKSNKSIE